MKLDVAALCFFLLAIGQNMTGVGNEWYGYACFYATGIILFIRLVRRVLGEKVEWQWQMLLVVFVSSFFIIITVPSVEANIQAKLSSQVPIFVVHVPPPEFTVLNVTPPSRAISFAPVKPTEKPDVAAVLVYPEAFSLLILNQSNVVLDRPKWWFALADLDVKDESVGSDVPKMLPIPVQVGDFIKPHAGLGPQDIFSNPNVKAIVKPGHRIFGLVGVLCPECSKDRCYWIFSIFGKSAWYSEMNATCGVSGNLIDVMRSVRDHGEVELTALAPYTTRKAAISPPH